MKRQDVSGQNTLHTDGSGGAGTDVNVTGINGTAPATGGGASNAGTLRVIVATDSPSSGNPAAGATGAAVPASADYQGVNVGGNLRGTTGVNPSGSIFAEQVDVASIAGTTTATGNGVVGAGVQRVAIASDNTAFPVTISAGAAVIGHVITDTGSTTAVTGNVTVVQGTGTNLHAVIDSGSTTAVTGTVTTKETRAATPTTANVAGSASNVTLLASNGNRLGATIDNDSTAILYAKFGATASLSSFTVKIPAGAYYEVPFNYTGIIDGIWDSAAGNARVTEVTA